MSNGHHLTVGYLKDMIANLPDDTVVYYERIEDVYFKTHSWKAELKVPDDFEPNDRIYDSEYLEAFTSFVHKRGKKKYLCITAHY